MEGRASSENVASRATATAALVAIAVAAGLMLVATPILAAGGSALAFGATDAIAAHVFTLPSPTARVRIVARSLAAAAWGGALSTIVAARGTTSAGSVRLPLLAIVLAIGTVVGTYGTGGARATTTERLDSTRTGTPPRAPLAEAPLLGVLDVATAGWILVLALAAHEASFSRRVIAAAGAALGLLLRMLLVASLVRRAARAPEAPALAGVGFVLWVAAAGVACTLATTPTTWSGLGAALLLTFAALIAELRRKRPLVVFLRGSLAFAVATMLGVVTLLS